MYTDSKLFCIQQLSMDLFLIQLFLTLHYHPTLCPFPEAPPRCLWDSAMPCGGWLELSVSGMGHPQPLLTEAPQSPQPVPGHGHMAQWHKDSKEPEAAPDHLVTPPEISAAMRESSIVETGQCHLNCDEVLNMLVEHQYSPVLAVWDTHTATKAHSYYSFPNKAGCLYFTVLSFGRMLHLFDGMLHFIHQWFFSVRRV